jgi:hypothetical protein
MVLNNITSPFKISATSEKMEAAILAALEN